MLRMFVSEFADINLEKHWKIFSTRRDLTHNMKTFERHCPMLGFKGVKVPFFVSKLLNMLNVNSRLFLNSDLEISNCLPVQNSVICLILYRASSFTFWNIKIDNWISYFKERSWTECNSSHWTQNTEIFILIQTWCKAG